MKFFIYILMIFNLAFAKDFLVKDMRGVDVKISDSLTKIATIDDGFVEGVMTHLGVIDKVKVIGSWSMKRDYKYSFTKISGETYTLRGWNTMKYLHPWLNDLPCINSPQGNVINFEELANTNPQLVILRVGDCTLRGSNKDAVDKTISTIEALGLPLVVIYAPKGTEIATMKDEMRVLGEIFGQKEKALKLFDYLNKTQILIEERTKNLKDSEKVTMLYMGLNPNVRKNGGVATAFGVNTPESFIIEGIANAKNAFRGDGTNIILSTEQLYAINPDAIVLPTSNGYHPASELLDSPDFEKLGELKAVQNKRVYAMPWSPMNCARRVEYPIDMLIIAKAAYPKLFSDIKVHEFVLKFYKDVYGVDEATAKALRSEQILDWTVEDDF
ncbi:ABC transporter substrate-binding protein [Campylobacter sp. RM16192]|uniref:ABC transporter substrate-binding protein n=1 Tax=Campylobacter sp. RM16192 TaxID=1660080 RepID=UPI00145198A0|nr:ABC transporter substrate-binding protein [Campylobacter sp. RM16192]QCD53416.1 metal ion ABC transporter, periplasmic metal-binding protein [Campylobacter sp. RM16192]